MRGHGGWGLIMMESNSTPVTGKEIVGGLNTIITGTRTAIGTMAGSMTETEATMIIMTTTATIIATTTTTKTAKGQYAVSRGKKWASRYFGTP
jgi:hypothetical protein